MSAPHAAASLSALPDALRAALGHAHVRTDAQSLAAASTDARGRYHGHALCMALPGNVQEVSEVVRLCAQARASIVAQGGNTGLCAGATPDASGRQVLLSLRRMCAIRAVDATGLWLTAEAGCTLQQVQQAAQEAGLLFPLSLASQGSCTIGGNLATNAGGTQVLRYGNARALCLGLEVVDAQGQIYSGLSALYKDNRGYALRELFIGSEGTLGIITAATLRLFARPTASVCALLAVPHVEAALAALALARRHMGDALSACELMGGHALRLLAQYAPQQRLPSFCHTAPFSLLLECVDFDSAERATQRMEALLQAMLHAGCASDAVLAHNHAQAQQFWRARESIPQAQAAQGLNIKHDIALPLGELARFVRHTDAALHAACPHARIVCFGHLGDGNLHYNVQAPAGADAAAFLSAHEAAINRIVFDAVHAHGGSIAAEHGIGQLRCSVLPRYQSAQALEIMGRIKNALDPQGIFNPGKVLCAKPCAQTQAAPQDASARAKSGQHGFDGLEKDQNIERK